MIEIRAVKTADDLLAVYRFRYAVYVEEMHRSQAYADHQSRRIQDPLDVPSACVLAAWSNGNVIGTVRTNDIPDCDIGDYFYQYGIDQLSSDLIETTSLTTRLMVHPALRRGTLAVRLSCAAYRNALERGVTTDFIDCNSHLVRYFTGLGYCIHKDRLQHPEYGEVTVMRLDLLNGSHLESIRSPFRSILRSHKNIHCMSATTGE